MNTYKESIGYDSSEHRFGYFAMIFTAKIYDTSRFHKVLSVPLKIQLERFNGTVSYNRVHTVPM